MSTTIAQPADVLELLTRKFNPPHLPPRRIGGVGLHGAAGA